VVLTQLYGMPLLRYRMNDIIKVIALEDPETGVKLPQVVFQRKAGEVINLGNMVHLDEKSLWQAIAKCDVNYTEWCAFKDFDRSRALLHLYIELKDEIDTGELERRLDAQLRLVDSDYKDVEIYLKYWPLKITILAPGTFRAFAEERKKNGADLVHLKPAHVNAPEAELIQLRQVSEAAKVK
jgi:phenylacetate-coenzyme A ligase PaaK-like adenylate-forming protein